MHGKGVFLEGGNTDGKRYDGYWDANIKVGIGVAVPAIDAKSDKTVVKRSKYDAAWTFEGNIIKS